MNTTAEKERICAEACKLIEKEIREDAAAKGRKWGHLRPVADVLVEYDDEKNGELGRMRSAVRAMKEGPKRHDLDVIQEIPAREAQIRLLTDRWNAERRELEIKLKDEVFKASNELASVFSAIAKALTEQIVAQIRPFAPKEEEHVLRGIARQVPCVKLALSRSKSGCTTDGDCSILLERVRKVAAGDPFF